MHSKWTKVKYEVKYGKTYGAYGQRFGNRYKVEQVKEDHMEAIMKQNVMAQNIWGKT